MGVKALVEIRLIAFFQPGESTVKPKRKSRTQVAALPFRVLQGALEVMLITSRETGRWIVPKGWPQKGRALHAVASREAYEEAGLVGRVKKRPIGAYRYAKRLPFKSTIVCKVSVFPLHVEKELDDYPEKDFRQRCWLTPDEAASRVEERGLSKLLLSCELRPCSR
jgi:8-oxo-dGTP pyrophosphatase MutT (NUDIX family)